MSDTQTILKATAGQIKEALAPFPRQKVRGGGEYLEVKYRLLAFRQHYPDASFDSSLAKLDGDRAVVNVSVWPNRAEWPQWNADGLAMHVVTGNIPDAVANAETSALGRALDKLGYGTGASFEEPKDEEGNIKHLAEAPFPSKDARPASTAPRPHLAVVPGQGPTPSPYPASTRQVGAIKAMLAQEFVGDDGKADWPSIGKYTGKLDDRDGTIYISGKQASRAIDYLRERQAQGVQGGGGLEEFRTVIADPAEGGPF